MAKPATKAIGKKQKGLLGLVTSSIFKVSTLTGLILGFTAHEYIERLIDSVFYRNVPVAKTSYQDPRGVDIKIYTNENGERQTYIVTTGENSLKLPLDRHLLPPSEYLEPELVERYKNMSHKEAMQVQPFFEKRLEILYRKTKPIKLTKK